VVQKPFMSMNVKVFERINFYFHFDHSDVRKTKRFGFDIETNGKEAKKLIGFMRVDINIRDSFKRNVKILVS
jgi:hypothetical protein